MNLILLCFQQLWNFKNFERLYLKTSIMALEYFFHYSLQFVFLPSDILVLGGQKGRIEKKQSPTEACVKILPKSELWENYAKFSFLNSYQETLSMVISKMVHFKFKIWHELRPL